MRMMNRGKGLGAKIREGGAGVVEFEFDDFRDFRYVEVIVYHVVGFIPGSVEDGTKDLKLETLDALDVAGLAEPHNSMS